MTTIASPLLAEILDRAAAAPATEICGLLFGTQEHIAGAEHTANVAVHPHDSFEVDPARLLAALRAERQGGTACVGHYHSHPNGSPDPSPRDLAAAEPGRLWLIVGSGAARLWLAEPGSFRRLPLDPV